MGKKKNEHLSLILVMKRPKHNKHPKRPVNYVRTRKSFVYLPSQYFNLLFTAGISPTSLLSYFNDETRVYLLFEIRGSFDMLQQSHPEGRQTFKSTNIFLTRWPETDLVVIDTILSLLLFRRHADTIDGLRCDVATASLRNGRLA